MIRRAHLSLVPKPGIQRLAQREKLIAEAKRLFPGNDALAAKWVDAKLTLGERQPSVEIGIQRVDTTKSLRALPIGSVAVRSDLPRFLRRFIRD